MIIKNKDRYIQILKNKLKKANFDLFSLKTEYQKLSYDWYSYKLRYEGLMEMDEVKNAAILGAKMYRKGFETGKRQTVYAFELKRKDRLQPILKKK